ncbi:MAG: glycosyltransferase 87 family protein [Thermoanaerobaculia bacterium]
MSSWILGLAALAPAVASLLLPDGRQGDQRVLWLGAAVAFGLCSLLLALHFGPRTRFAPAAQAAAAGFQPRLLLLVALSARLLAAFGPLRFDDDLWRYLWDGIATSSGVSPYRFAPSQVLEHDPRFDALLLDPADEAALERLARRAEGAPARQALEHINFPFYPTLYPPTSQLAFAATAALAPGSPRLLRLLFALADTGTVALLLGLLRRLGKPPWWALAYAWHPLPILELSAAGHQDALGIALVLAGAFSLLAARRGAAGALAAAAAGVKLFPAGLLWLWCRPLGRRGSVGALVAALALLLPFAWLGPPSLAGLGAYLGRWEFFSGPFAVLTALLGGRADLARGAVALAALGWLVALRPWREGTTALALERGWSWVEGMLVLSPVVDPWYLPWALAPTVLRGSLAWPLFATLVPLSYLPAGPNGHSAALRAAVWLPFLAVWVWEKRGWVRGWTPGMLEVST